MRYDSFVSPKSNKQIEEISYAWRIALSIQDQFAPDMARIFEHVLPNLLGEHGFKMRLEEPKEKSFEAYTAFEPSEIVFAPDTYDRLSRWEGRARFTAAHELGHLVMHHSESRPRASAIRTDNAIPAIQSAEHQANRFAASFLMPEDLLRLNRASVSEIAILFQVSEVAAERRLRELALMPKRQLPEAVVKYLEQTKNPNHIR